MGAWKKWDWVGGIDGKFEDWCALDDRYSGWLAAVGVDGEEVEKAENSLENIYDNCCIYVAPDGSGIWRDSEMIPEEANTDNRQADMRHDEGVVKLLSNWEYGKHHKSSHETCRLPNVRRLLEEL